MMVKLYVNWYNNTIFNEKQAKEIVRDEYFPSATSLDSFDEYLSENYSCVELFDMGEDEKKAVHTEFMKAIEKATWENFIADGYEEVSVEI